MSLREVSAREVMNEDPETVRNDSTIAKAKNKMEENELRAIPVVDSKDRLKGALSYRDIIRHVQFNPDTTKLDKVMHQPPEFDKSDSLVDIADLRIQSGKKMLVNTENEGLADIIGDREFRKALSEAEEFEQVSTEEIVSDELLTIFEDDSIEKARHKMLDENISRLPVINSKGKLSGMVTSVDLLKTVVTREGQASGGTSGDSLRSTQIAGGSEKDSMADITVEEIMNRTPLTIQGYPSASETIQKMEQKDKKEAIILKDGEPDAIVTVKDYVKEVSELKQRNMVLVNLTGIEVDEEKEAVHQKIETQLRGSLGRKLRQPEEISLRVKKAEKDGKKHRYEATMKLFSEYGQITSQSEAWNLLEVVDDCLNELDRAVRDEKEQRTDH